jgi:DNA-directed RNA polymerase subunit RPC12/RpoP
MDVEGVRIACPACGYRLTVMPRVDYLACARCGSEYLVQRKGSSIGLEPFAPEQYELSRQIAGIEAAQGAACSNVFFWILLVAGVLFCGLGFLTRALFQTSVIFVLGWAISLLALAAAAVVLLRHLNAQRAERLKLERRRQELYEQMGGGTNGK